MQENEIIYYIDESKLLYPTIGFMYKAFSGSVDEAKEAFKHTDDFGVLYIPAYKLQTRRHRLYTKINRVRKTSEASAGCLKLNKDKKNAEDEPGANDSIV